MVGPYFDRLVGFDLRIGVGGLDVVGDGILVHLNNKYVRHGNLELDKLFIKEDVTEIALSKQKEIEDR